MPHRTVNSLVLSMARTGSVALPSGEWAWCLDLDGDRFRVRFQHAEEPHQEMLAYCRRATVTSEIISAHAREPLYRCWTDAEGLRWRLRSEIPSWIWTGVRPDVEVMGELVWLVFECETNRRFAWMPRRLRVGELTNAEIFRLMESSEPFSLSGWEPVTRSRAG